MSAVFIWSQALLVRGVALSQAGQPWEAVEAINRGRVYYFVLKPWRNEELLQILRNAAEKSLLERNRDQLLDRVAATIAAAGFAHRFFRFLGRVAQPGQHL